jgi:hypothetical protein
MYQLHRQKCFRDAGLWGIGMGAVMAGHSVLRHRSQQKAMDAFMWTTLGVGVGMWSWCRYKQRSEKEMFTKAMTVIAAKQEREAKEKAGAAAAPAK